jgi:hypothetical protein
MRHGWDESLSWKDQAKRDLGFDKQMHDALVEAPNFNDGFPGVAGAGFHGFTIAVEMKRWWSAGVVFEERDASVETNTA